MNTILAATDLSPRSRPALLRAAHVAERLHAKLQLLHVVDSDQGALLPKELLDQAWLLLEDQARDLAPELPIKPELDLKVGSPFRCIVDTADSLDARLLVLGPHRLHLLSDVFTGTTSERVMRLGQRPVLRAGGRQHWPYRKIMAAVDMSACAGQALQQVKVLGLLEGAELLLAHVFEPLGEGLALYSGPDDSRVKAHIEQRRGAALADIDKFMQNLGLAELPHRVQVLEGRPFFGLQQLVASEEPDLLVIGTRGQSGAKRVLLGSVADAALREFDCDILAVPPRT